ncbi:vanillate O-demethylase oxidoreductase VanB [Leptospira ognonensis]|uniref:Vanillate O-demethylase oxidoreductase VanB n=1 Tax=Leptospira ognonensis TaxID=2484945 RepID=A0A4R9K1P7_9LEPT|nr:SRPBCC family protein [Leptospira ognonensis]TGL59071.1 vanillate O-demethylase oxidoreductase VanB [Leptospira ognonensis]
MENSENSIERKIEIKAPIEKVWTALTDVKQFGKWFGVDLESDFIAGKTTHGRNTSKGFEMQMTFNIKKIQPTSYFSYTWIPFPMDQSFDYSKEEPTLVEFFLEGKGNMTLVKVIESGFDQITAVRRAEAFRMHSGGWEAQLNNIANFVANEV